MHAHPSTGTPSHDRLALSATLHCLTGCAIGEVLGQQLGADLANVLERSPDADRFVLRAGWNWPEAWVGTRTVPAGRRSLAGYVVETGGPIVVDDLRAEERFDPPPLMLAAGIASSLTVPIGPEDEVFGVLSVHSQRRRAFSADDTSFAQGVANVLAAAVRRARDDEALREGEASLQLVLAGTRTAAWWWEVGENRIRWSEGVAALHGLPEDGAPVEYEQLIELVHPDDRAALDGAVRRSVEEGVGYELVFRIVRPDGGVRWLETEAHAERDAAGGTLRLMGIVRDVTDRRLAELRERLLADASELLGRAGDVESALRELTARLAHLADDVAIELASVGDVAADPAEPVGIEHDASGSSLVVPLRGRAGVLGALRLSAAAGAGQRRFDETASAGTVTSCAPSCTTRKAASAPSAADASRTNAAPTSSRVVAVARAAARSCRRARRAASCSASCRARRSASRSRAPSSAAATRLASSTPPTRLSLIHI